MCPRTVTHMGHALRIADLESAQRPRERLSQLGPRSLTDAELLAILVGSGRAGMNAIDLAHNVIADRGGLGGLATASVQDLLRLKGVGLAAAARVCAMAEIARRTTDTAVSTAPLRTSADIAEAVISMFRDCTTERLVVAVLNRALRLVDMVVLTEGTSTHTTAPVADILRAVLIRNGSAFALAHNHPGGSVEPSAADLKATAAVRDAAVACGLRFLDHIVVAGTRWRSVTTLL